MLPASKGCSSRIKTVKTTINSGFEAQADSLGSLSIQLDGRTLVYLRAGSGPALLLVHGLLGYSFSWRYTVPALAKIATVYAPDLPGAGFSEPTEDMDCCFRACAERVLRLMDSIGVTDCDLLGTSHGGAVAMMTAALLAERRNLHLKRLILVAPVNPWSRHGKRLAPFLVSPFGAFVFRHTIERWRTLDYLWLRRLFGDGARIPPDSLAGYRVPVVHNHGFRHASHILSTWTADLQDLERVLP
ncbi:MAG TPA: alpha/beta fold hydrolase, partial [Terriglobales bacterium]|nr:alpha/beta fold hydrolase [Terriglobales bacterium]